MRRAIALATVSLTLLPHTPAQRILTEEEALDLAFPGAAVEHEMFVLDAEQRAKAAERTGIRALPRIVKVLVARRDGRAIGYAVVDDVPGKARPITFMAAVGTDLRVRRIDILVYRESHGWEVRHEGWREQFVGKSLDDPLRVGRDIRNISGATISCRSVTDGVRRLVGVLSVLDLPQPSPGEEHPEPAANGDGEHHPATDSEPTRAGEPTRRGRVLMGTTLDVTLFGDGAAAAAEAALEEVARVESALSDWREDTALARLNRDAGGPPSPCPPVLLAFLANARRWTRATGGAVDVTAGPLVRLWRRAAERGEVPGDAAITATRARSGDSVLVLDPEAGTAGLRVAGAALDPGAIGKGWALDRAAEVLGRHGAGHALLNFGGQILAVGPRPDGTPWPVGLRDGGIELEVCAGSVATTADTERGLEVAGRRVSHVVDPRTGRPVEGMRAVTVHAPDATTADALSTALFVMGFEDAVAWSRRHGTATRIEASDGRIHESDGFTALRTAASPPARPAAAPATRTGREP